MKGVFLTIIAVLLFTGSSTLSAQKIVYVDKHFQWTTDKEKAVEYAVISKAKKKQTKVEFYTLDGRLKGIGHYSAYTKEPKNRVRNGVCTFLYANGKDSLVNIYKENRLEGQSIAYYPEGNTKLIITYKDGKMEGKLVGYYPDGKLRREESYLNDKCTDGKLLAADGSELSFEPYFVAPEFPGGIDALAKLLKDNLAYPLDAVRAKTEGKVILRIVIDEKGHMTAPRLISGVDPLLDKEAMRIVEAIGRTHTWTPGKIDGEAKRISYTLPINFHLPS